MDDAPLAARLARATSSPLVRGALIFDREGHLLASTPGTDCREPRCVVLAALLGVADRVFASGGVQHLLAQHEEGRLIVHPVGETHVLASFVQSSAELGAALPILARAAGQLAGAV